VHSTGHDLTGLSALWEYLGARVALCMAGAIVLAGWPAMPRGQLGRGPTPPTMAAVPGLSESAVNNYADLLFNLRPNSPPWLLIGGSLRQLVLDALAVLIMYYAERFSANEMPAVLNAMRSKFLAMSLAVTSPHETLLNWSQLIMAKFTSDNLHLTGGLDKSGTAQVISAVQQINRLIQGYKDKSENPPKILTTGYSPSKSLFINSLDSHVSKTGITSSRKAFQLSQP